MTTPPYGNISPEAALDQLRRVQSVTDAALAQLAVEDLLDELLVRVREALDADTAAILLLNDLGTELIARAAKGIEEEVEQGVRIPVGHGFAGKIAAEQRPVVLREVDQSNVMNPILREKGIRSIMGVPLVAQGKSIGVLHVGSLEPRDFTEADVRLLQLVGDRVALAIHIGLYEREQYIAETLQRSLLPERLPTVLGVDFSASYLPASDSGVGGDFYDAFPLPSGRIVVAVGDVVGRGLRAASVTGRLRNALRAYAFEGLEPAKVVDSLNAMMHFLDPDEMATLIYGVIELEQRRISIVNAGHLPPVIVDGDGHATFFDRSGTPPLGARPSLRSVMHNVELEPGSLVIFYTDGLVERRNESLNDRLELLRRVAERHVPVGDLPTELADELTPEGTDDDVAILCMRFAVDVSHPYTISLPAEPVQLAAIRSMLRTWLAEIGVPDALTYDILVATGEACANAIEHAYGLRPGRLQIDVSRSDSRLLVSIKDQGSWREARGENRGRGLPIMKRLASAVDVVRTSDGTDVRLTWDLEGGR
jgi:anti-sigma regulatory factor (Ser/Thr protein kinase)/putative methionine-R-sulfoxide reductase with GAF domain